MYAIAKVVSAHRRFAAVHRTAPEEREREQLFDRHFTSDFQILIIPKGHRYKTGTNERDVTKLTKQEHKDIKKKRKRNYLTNRNRRESIVIVLVRVSPAVSGCVV